MLRGIWKVSVVGEGVVEHEQEVAKSCVFWEDLALGVTRVTAVKRLAHLVQGHWSLRVSASSSSCSSSAPL